MKVKLVQNIVNLFGDEKTIPAGTVVEIDEGTASKQIARGLMVKYVKTPEPAVLKKETEEDRVKKAAEEKAKKEAIENEAKKAAENLEKKTPAKTSKTETKKIKKY